MAPAKFWSIRTWATCAMHAMRMSSQSFHVGSAGIQTSPVKATKTSLARHHKPATSGSSFTRRLVGKMMENGYPNMLICSS